MLGEMKNILHVLVKSLCKLEHIIFVDQIMSDDNPIGIDFKCL